MRLLSPRHWSPQTAVYVGFLSVVTSIVVLLLGVGALAPPRIDLVGGAIAGVAGWLLLVFGLRLIRAQLSDRD